MGKKGTKDNIVIDCLDKKMDSRARVLHMMNNDAAALSRDTAAPTAACTSRNTPPSGFKPGFPRPERRGLPLELGSR